MSLYQDTSTVSGNSASGSATQYNNLNLCNVNIFMVAKDDIPIATKGRMISGLLRRNGMPEDIINEGTYYANSLAQFMILFANRIFPQCLDTSMRGFQKN